MKTSDKSFNLIELIAKNNTKEAVFWVINKRGEYLFISIDFPLSKRKNKKNEKFEIAAEEEKRFGQRVFSIKIPIVYDDEECLLGLSLLVTSEKIDLIQMNSFIKILTFIDNPKTNIYLKSKENDDYFFVSNGNKNQLKKESSNQKFKYPVSAKELFDEDMYNFIKTSDINVFESNITQIKEECPPSINKTFVSVKTPFTMCGKTWLFGYSVLVQDYLDEIEKLKENALFSLENKIDSILHDISSPINSSLQLLDLLKIKEDNEKKKDYLDSIFFTLSSIKENISMLIKDEFDKEENVEAISFAATKNFLLGLYLLPAITKGLSIKINIDSTINDRKKIYLKKNMLLRVLINLLNNSVKYSQKGNVVLHFSRIDNYVSIEITDNSAGFPASVLRSLRNKKFLENQKIEENSGFGWRLISSNIDCMGGFFFIRNTEHGSAVNVFIPIN